MQLEPHQTRVVDEAEQLVAKISALKAFIDSPRFNTVGFAERVRMMRQLVAMAEYASILAARMNAWTATPPRALKDV